MRRVLALVLLTIAAIEVPAEKLRELEVRNQRIQDVLLSLGKLYDASILPDETVTGTVSYFFSEPDLESALHMLLPSLGLYYWKQDGLYHVSRLRVTRPENGQAIDIDANDVPISLLLDRIAQSAGVPLLYQDIEGLRMNLHAKGTTPRKVLDLVSLQYPELSVFEEKGGFLLRRFPVSSDRESSAAQATLARHFIRRTGETYTIDAPAMRFKSLVSGLFEEAEREYLLVGKNDPLLPPLRFDAKSFESMLGLLLDLGSSRTGESDGIYYVYDVGSDLALSRLTRTLVVPMQHLSVDTLTDLLPRQFTRSDRYRIDSLTNSVVLTGRSADIVPIQKYLAQLDHPRGNTSYHRFDLSHLSAGKLLSILPKEFNRRAPLPIPGRQSIVVSLTTAEAQRLREYIASVDTPPESTPITLHYVRVPDLLEHLPPGISSEDIVVTLDPSRFFFVGGPKKQALLREHLRVLDLPPRQIRYELVVVQYHDGSTANREIELNSTTVAPGDRNAILGTIGRLLSLRFDFVSAFGYLFALKLNFDLASAHARVLADTTLNGISGESIAFRNTNTFRYRDTVVNPDTGKLDPTGVVREITSGLTIEVSGWVSGEGLVTMDVTSSVSARGADTSGSATALPATSEKVVRTHVRTPSGTPVVIGGLKELTSDSRSDRVPILGDLPLLGALFEKAQQASQDTELAIYILPEVEEVTAPEEELTESLLRAYHRLAGGLSGEQH